MLLHNSGNMDTNKALNNLLANQPLNRFNSYPTNLVRQGNHLFSFFKLFNSR